MGKPEYDYASTSSETNKRMQASMLVVSRFEVFSRSTARAPSAIGYLWGS